MIKFFRRIRQQLLSENKFSKYLLYALGEIVLVVIGILIALQINNWNQAQKDLKLENNYYCRILEDFELDRTLISNSILEVENKIVVSKQLIIDMHRSDKDKNTLLNEWLKSIRLEVYVPRKVAFQDLTTSGNLRLLNNLELKNSLSQYYSNLENLLKQINQNRDELVQRSYPVDATGLGVQEFEYVKNSIGKDVYDLLPKLDWIHDTNHEYFKKFQSDLVFNIAMYERHKQHLKRILREMETPYEKLKETCT